MQVLKVYKDMEVSYQELDAALTTLGFRHKIVKRDLIEPRMLDTIPDKVIFFKNEKADIYFSFPFVSFKSKILKGDFASLCHQLEQLGLINAFDDLAKMIEKNRLAEKSASA